MSDPSPNVNIALVSFTDLVKALREALGLVGDVQKKVTSTSQAYQRFKGKKAAKNLGALSFPPDESRLYLARIAEGEGSPADFLRIKELLSETGDQIEQSIAKLDGYTDMVREQYGLAASHKLADIIRGDGGKTSIRFDLELLAAQGDEPFFDQNAVADEAARILESIDRLNQNLTEMHDMVLGHTKP